MPKSVKPLEVQLEEARRRLADLRHRKRLVDAAWRRKERALREKKAMLIGRCWLKKHEALAASDPAAAEREWQDMLANLDGFLRTPADRRLFGLEPVAADAPATEEPPGTAEKPPPAADAAAKPVKTKRRAAKKRKRNTPG